MKKSDTLAMLALFEAAYSFAYTDAQHTLWCEFMADVSLEAGVNAARTWIAEHPRAPTIADMRKRVSEQSVNAPDVDQAWAEVQRAIARVGRNPFRVVNGVEVSALAWSSPQVQQAVETIGWQAICDTPEDQVRTLFAQFRDTYNAGKGRAVRDENVKALPAAPVAALVGDVTRRLKP